MTEEEARQWVAERFGSTAPGRLHQFVGLLVAEAVRQNLIAPSTIETVWVRHIVDSAQLAIWSDEKEGTWLDVGSGSGLPGIVLALLVERPFVLCEPRRLRAEFLTRAVDELGLSTQVSVEQRRVETLALRATTITARAVSGLDALLRASRHCADRNTRWILPRGQSGAAEIQASTMLNRAVFHVEPSVTDPTAAILIAQGVT